MKILGDYLSKNIATARIEKKFLMSAGQSSITKILFKTYGFKKAYPDRQVHSYYFDSIDLDSLRENIDGVNERDKLRVRYYNNDLTSARIEIKHKRGDVGYKSIIDTSGHIVNEKMLLKAVSDWCSIHVRKKLVPTVYVKYNRVYYKQQWLRATFDTNIKMYRVVGSKLILSAMRDYEVIEFKYPVKYDNEFRAVYKDLDWISLRNTKSSKYSNALMY